MSIRTFATPLVVGATIPLCITGICMLFGVRGGIIDPVHEIASIAFLVGTVLHVAINWRALIAHLRKPLGKSLVGAFTLVTALALFSLAYQQGSGHPRALASQSVALMLDAELSTLASLTHHTGQELIVILAEQGIRAADSSATLRGLADVNHRQPLELLEILLH